MKKKKKVKEEMKPLITFEDPRSVTSEKFRGIRSNILFSSVDVDIQSVVFTSEKPSAGKSTVSANIAITYAQAGYRTLLIDGDMRKPTQHYSFNHSNLEGLSTLILNKGNQEEIVKQTEITNLSLLTSGPIPPNPSELIGSQQMIDLLEKLKNEYDIIIIDTPPVNTVTDAQIFAKLAQNVVYVLDAQSNDRKSVIKGKGLLEKTGAKIVGVVFNKAPLDKSTNYYSYYGEDSK